jgi:hypothetical protein
MIFDGQYVINKNFMEIDLKPFLYGNLKIWNALSIINITLFLYSTC